MLDRLYVSQKAYDLGLYYVEEDEHFLAMQQFALVISQAKEYEDAQRLLVQAEDDFREHYLSAAKEAQRNGDYKSSLAYLEEAIALEALEIFLERRMEYEEQWAANALEVLERTRDHFGHRLISLDEAEALLWGLHGDGHYDTGFIQRELIYLSRLKASQQAFDSGNADLAQADYLGAMEQYSYVSEADFDYVRAQEKKRKHCRVFGILMF